ncbi:molybdopterin-dependent oxidoreductase [Pseudogulbenkiania ferrooxidans]|uniref:Oxidoreductase molybdopterin binding n=1 Tax=Pseudogulbenkiania ferrooxidans 2002 TaxID=279714 RepID=B9Z8V8_9NEIS|nr:molybdopterin-dependent oxidoreductase [Pseudogulbenkiania ferrooxidans]EEG06777.1 oxidoreductase molybdopterin binding [Pseudogulbenkiania ferrooxidans 2002]
MGINRRDFLRVGSGGLLLAGGGLLVPAWAKGAKLLQPAALPDGTRESALLEALPGKVPLIKRSYRPPNYETPPEYFREVFTPNKAFFVRYHLANIPEVEARSWQLRIGGEVESPLVLTLDELRRFETVELAAVCQCSGNRRGLFQPHVPGVEWSYGAMGNARWRGVRLRDLLNKAGVKKGALELVLDGADGPVLDKTPDFVKSLPLWKGLDENTLIAFEMNGEPLPHWNGFPARLIVPGWTATYWVKHLSSINVVSAPFDGFWMKSAYRVPVGKFPVVERFLSQETAANTPITEMVVNSLITSVRDGERLSLGKPLELAGIAWDAGYGIRQVEVSTDGGMSWRNAELGTDHGRFSFRPWHYRFQPRHKGRYTLLAKATNRIGQTQTFELIANPAGYHHNLVHQVAVDVV